MRRMWLDNLIIGETDECWPWGGAFRNNHGYAQVNAGLAHRLVYEIVKGPIPAGHQIDHLCRRCDCVNPAHLEAVTPRENQARGETFTGRADRGSLCPHGHAYDSTTRGFRRCLTCHREQERAHNAKRRLPS